MADQPEVDEPDQATKPGAGDERPEAEPPWSELILRARRLPPPWRSADRLAVASLALMLVGLALPWAPTEQGDPLTLPQAARPGGVLTGTLAAAVVVSVWAARRHLVTDTAVVSAMVAAGVVTALGSLAVRAERDPLPLLVPGRIAAALGGTGLAVAGVVLAVRARRREERLWTLERAVRRPAGQRPTPVPVGELLSVAPPARRSYGFGLAAGLNVLAALALLGPWWRSPSPLYGPPAGAQGPGSDLDARMRAALVGRARCVGRR